MRAGDLVRFLEALEPGDESAAFIVVELRGPRVLVEALNTGMSIAPQFSYNKTELVKS